MTIHFFRFFTLIALSVGVSFPLITSVEAVVKKPKVSNYKASSYQPKYSAIVIDAQTGKVLHEEDADGARHPASLTKMMTLYMLFEAVKTGKLKMDSTLPVSAKASRQSPSKLGLLPGQTITVRTAMLGLITKSANDVAVTVGEYLGGSEEAFARKMTLKAQALGMSNTIFKNASGLPNPQQITSARDMATLSRALYRDFPREYKHFATQSFSHKGTVHRTHNHLLGKVHGVDGIKTGWIVASGFNLAASAIRYDDQNKPHRLITVVLGGANRHWRDRRVEELLETYFAQRGLKKGSQQEGLKEKTQKVVVIEEGDDQVQAPLNELIYEVNDDADTANDDSDAANDDSDQAHLDSVVMESISEDEETVQSISDFQSTKSQETLPTNWVVPKVRKSGEDVVVLPRPAKRHKKVGKVKKTAVTQQVSQKTGKKGKTKRV